jgi:hypothetical protein
MIHSDEPLSNFGVNLNLRHYSSEQIAMVERDAEDSDVETDDDLDEEMEFEAWQGGH